MSASPDCLGVNDVREMKESGISCYGKVPAAWESIKLKNILTLRSIKSGGVGELLSVYLDRGVISYSDSDGQQVHKPSQDMSNYQIVKVGDFVLNNQQAWRGSVGVSRYDGIISPAYFVYDISERCDPLYMNFALRDCCMVQQYETASRGVGTIQRNLFAPWLLESMIVLPDLPEQHAIATFLNGRCAEIDQIAAGIQAEIEMLEEYRNSVISEAVTHGLDSSAPIKESGTPWCPHIPEHWQATNPKALFYLRNQRAFPGERQLTASQRHGIMYQDEFMELENQQVVTVEKDFSILKHVEPNDFVISMRSFQGGLEYSEVSGCISSAYVMLIPNMDKVYPPFWKWFFKSSKYINAIQSTTNLVRDGQAMRYANFVMVPLFIIPMDEQRRIAEYLNDKVSQIDAILADKRAQLATLEEYKKSLIFEYVTGKKEVPA